MDLDEDPDTNRSTAVPLKDLSDDVRRDIQDRLTIYTVALCYISDSTKKPQLGGSGTLVYANDKYGVLTAGHVVETLRQKKSIGIAGLQRGAVKIQNEDVLWYETGGPYAAGDRADLGFIQLVPEDVAAIKPRKTFLNLDRAYDEITGNTYRSSDGVWCTCGFPGELGSGEELYGLTGVGLNPSCSNVGEFDYIEITTEIQGGLPRTYGGMSGGGVWHVPLMETGGNHQIVGCYFAGVMFYQSQVTDQKRDIKCHGPNSVYVYVGDNWLGGLDC